MFCFTHSLLGAPAWTTITHNHKEYVEENTQRVIACFWTIYGKAVKSYHLQHIMDIVNLFDVISRYSSTAPSVAAIGKSYPTRTCIETPKKETLRAKSATPHSAPGTTSLSVASHTNMHIHTFLPCKASFERFCH